MNYSDALYLSGEKWNTLDDEGKLSILQSIENHQAALCGRDAVPVEGRFLYTGTEGIAMGYYSRDENIICVNTSQFDPDSMYGKDSSELIKTCLHEGRHAYQYQVVEGNVFHPDGEEARSWRENLAPGNYIKYSEDPRGYYEQSVEKDARAFADEKYSELLEERSFLIGTKDEFPLEKSAYSDTVFESSGTVISYNDSVRQESEAVSTGTAESVSAGCNMSGGAESAADSFEKSLSTPPVLSGSLHESQGIHS